MEIDNVNEQGRLKRKVSKNERERQRANARAWAKDEGKKRMYHNSTTTTNEVQKKPTQMEKTEQKARAREWAETERKRLDAIERAKSWLERQGDI